MTNHYSLRAILARVALALLFAIQLTACGGGGGGGGTGTAAPASSDPVDVAIAGSVGDGPVTGATIEVLSNDGRLLGSMTSDAAASFNSTLKVKGKDYPLRLKVSGGIDLVTGQTPDFQMLSVMLSPGDKEVNITPFSTLIVLVAERLPGGLKQTNVETARQYVIDRLGFGLDGELLADPLTGGVTDANVANLVKSSEALGEMVRRTRDLLMATGRSLDGDAVLRALAADLQDGLIDGLGVAGVDETISAVANVVAGQVLVEALSNSLEVGGVIATGVIDQAIMTTRPGVSDGQLTGSVAASAGMLAQARAALAAAQVVDAGGEVQALATAVGGLSAGVLPGEAAAVLPAGSSAVLDDALVQTAYAPDPTLADVNTVASGGVAVNTDPGGGGDTTGSDGTADTTQPNSAPVISGTPAASVVANSSYLFQPAAADADGDPMKFSVKNLPVWAGFDVSNGRLSGTPGDADVGSYSNIVISVTDGIDIAQLPAFSIQVAADQTQGGTLSLSWSPPVARADGTPLTLADIDGYHIHYGDVPGGYTETVTIADGSAVSATINNLPAGSYYLVMTTYDKNGLESGYSAEITKQVY